MNQPWCYRPWEIKQLTDRQIWDLILCEKDEEGQVKPPAPKASDWQAETIEEKKAVFTAVCRNFGMNYEAIKAKWEEKQGPGSFGSDPWPT